MSRAYDQLEARFKKASVLGDALSVLHWDMSTMMPDGGAEARAEQLALLKTLAHQAVTGDDMADLLAAAQADGLDDWERANLREMRRDWVHAAAVPADLVDAMAKAEALGVGIYDALLDQYEPDGRSADIDRVFADLESFLPDFIAQALDAQQSRPAPLAPQGPFAVEKQKELGHKVMVALGFDFHRGRQDVSAHPFCGGYPEDVRITTRYNTDDFATALMGVIHETGHALYDFGLPGGKWRTQPVGRARGMQIHESQSLLMEMQACRSRPFLAYAAPLMQETFGGQGPAWEAENLYRLSTRVKRGFIRVDADECTYPAHVIIRYGLEKALIEGRMDLADLPGAWNDGYRRLLGITPPDDRLGCLQDIHWYGGAWGYFPTYTLGAMSAAQFFAAAKQADPQIEPAIGRGDFAPLLAWLRANVHGLGSSLSTTEMLVKATGKPLDAGVFKAHLTKRYLG